ncbi:DUF7553 family protein [Halostella litorea]|uniref:DUF7553 family protein n=1 Tax=Halostella litorea TaxID=2528831 RepID=UPI00109190FD|nr:hypothetical protein [Halostella litorea]
MVREELQRASDRLREASEAADEDEVRDRLYDQSDEFARLATADRGPDHGRLARHENILAEIRKNANDAVGEHIDAAKDAITEYRKDLPGV